jgi:hypothetical protein
VYKLWLVVREAKRWPGAVNGEQNLERHPQFPGEEPLNLAGVSYGIIVGPEGLAHLLPSGGVGWSRGSNLDHDVRYQSG